MRILIVEPHADGHHASYVRWLVQAIVERRWSAVIATTAEATNHPSLRTIVADFRDVSWHLIEDIPRYAGWAGRHLRLMRREFAYWSEFRRIADEASAKNSIDAIILPYVDYCFFALACLGSPFRRFPWCAISMRLSVNREASKGNAAVPLKWRAARRLLGGSNLKALFVINPSVKDVPVKWCSPLMLSKIRYLRDPAEPQRMSVSPRASRSALGIEDGDVAVLVFGSIDERKGIDALLRTLAAYESLRNFRVILAGRQSEAVQSEIRAGRYAQLQLRNRLIMIDRFLTEAEQAMVFTAADVVWVGYWRHVYMSGVLVLAGKAGLPVVGTRDGEIGRLIADYKLGVSARVDVPSELEAALRAMLDARERVAMGKRGQAAFAGHSIENFGADVLGCFHSSSNG